MRTPSTPSTNNQSPPRTPTTDSTHNSPLSPSSPDPGTHKLHNQIPTNPTSLESATMSSLTNSQPFSSMPHLGTHQDQTYLVSLLHVLPFLFHHKPLLPQMKDRVLQPLNHQELKENSRDLGVMNLNQRLMVPQPLNILYSMKYHRSLCAALNPLPISAPSINLALTLILARYPSCYGWNHPNHSHTSLTTLMTQTPASKSTLPTEDYQYERNYKGISITGSNGSHWLYQDRSFIPTPQHTHTNNHFPYGWSAGIKDFCVTNGHHPDCANPIRRTFIECEFIAHTIDNLELFKPLDEYLNIIHTNTIGKRLQWLKSSPTPIPDDPHKRDQLSQLYTQINCQKGQALHSKNGL